MFEDLWDGWDGHGVIQMKIKLSLIVLSTATVKSIKMFIKKKKNNQKITFLHICVYVQCFSYVQTLKTYFYLLVQSSCATELYL